MTKRHLTFVGGHVRILAIKEKAMTKTVKVGCVQRVGGWCEPIERVK